MMMLPLPEAAGERYTFCSQNSATMSFIAKVISVSLALASWHCPAAQIGTPRAVSAPPAALVSQTPSSGSSMPVVSADGRYVVFVSRSANLVTNPTTGSYQIFLRDLANSNIVLVSATALDTGGNDHSLLPSVSSNGLWIAFESEASDLVAGDTNGVSDVFVRDVAGGHTILVASASRNPMISADGRYVAFESRAQDVFIRDVVLGTTTLVNVNIEGTGSPNRGSELLTMTPDGRFVAFWTD